MKREQWIPLAAFGLDLLFGDPAWLPHPVVMMGKAVRWSERVLRKRFPETPEGERWAGAVLAFGLPAASFAAAEGTISCISRLSPWAGRALSVFWGYQVLAVRDMLCESGNVRRTLEQGTLEEARRAVGRIVGRDTGALDREGVARAAVESVAESFSDGVIAPLFYLFLGGPPLALAYKAVNTMDSMIGYKNKRYFNFGRAAARLDDLWNFLPARLSGLLLTGAAFLCKEDGRGAFSVFLRDRGKTESPNAGQTEAAMAGALGVSLGGPASYFGETVEKPVLGDGERPVGPEEIARAERLFLAGAVLGTAVFAAGSGISLIGRKYILSRYNK